MTAAHSRPLRRARLALALGSTLLAAACGGGSFSAASGASRPALPPPPPPGCAGKAAPFASRLLVGLTASDATASKPGFDLRYVYVAGVTAPDPACYGAATAAGCGTSWWGTWQDPARPPGQYVRDFVARAEAEGRVPWISYYVLLPASRAVLGTAEGAPEVTQAATNAAFMQAYLTDFRFLLDQLGAHTAFVHVDPDFWGYAQQAGRAAGVGPDGLPASVASADPADCAGFADTIAGLGRCMIAMARARAPNARVGLHGSAWASGYDCVLNSDPGLDVAAEARKTGAFLAGCGAGGGDFVAVDIADRDAGWRQAVLHQDTWLDPTDATLPSFAQAFAWSSALAGAVGRPLAWWQVPVGNTGLPDVDGAWRDNRVQYFLAHTDRVAASGAVAVAFGAGDGAQTTPDSDGGYLAAAAAVVAAAGGQPLCP